VRPRPASRMPPPWEKALRHRRTQCGGAETPISCTGCPYSIGKPNQADVDVSKSTDSSRGARPPFSLAQRRQRLDFACRRRRSSRADVNESPRTPIPSDHGEPLCWQLVSGVRPYPNLRDRSSPHPARGRERTNPHQHLRRPRQARERRHFIGMSRRLTIQAYAELPQPLVEVLHNAL